MRLKSPVRFITFIAVVCAAIVVSVVVASKPHTKEVTVAHVVKYDSAPVVEARAVRHVPVVNTPRVIEKVSRGGSRVSSEERYYLAKAIHCEAGVDSMAGKLAVGQAILNRTKHPNRNLFGGPTIKGVVLHKLPGSRVHQFSCVDDARLWSEQPTEEDYEAADKVLSGYKVFRDSFVYYYNPRISRGIAGVSCTYRVGMHVFGEE